MANGNMFNRMEIDVGVIDHGKNVRMKKMKITLSK
jgi:hypothetical protein